MVHETINLEQNRTTDEQPLWGWRFLGLTEGEAPAAKLSMNPTWPHWFVIILFDWWHFISWRSSIFSWLFDQRRSESST
jgi:hypothetical protein